jgi:hypothetical protein
MSRRDLFLLLAAAGLTSQSASSAPETAKGPDAAKINPRSYKVLFENEKIRVLEYHSKPGLGVCGQGRHFHPQHLTIPLTAGKAKVRLQDGTVKVSEAKAGEMFWAKAEIHEAENVSGRDMRAYVIEFKDPDWKPSTG